MTPSTISAVGTTASHLEPSGLRWLALATAAATAITGGTLFAFSSFVLPGLGRLPTGQAVSAMQAINVAAPRSLLMVPLLGSAAGSAAVAVWAVARPDIPDRVWVLVGAGAGLATFVITAAYHVPHNNALARLDPNAPTTPALWTRYTIGWARWNHARTATALMSAAALVIANLHTR